MMDFTLASKFPDLKKGEHQLKSSRTVDKSTLQAKQRQNHLIQYNKIKPVRPGGGFRPLHFERIP
jgi:hypothetical protein